GTSIPGGWVQYIGSAREAGPWQRAEASKLAPKGCYRSKWYILGNDRGSFCGIGIHGQWVYVDPAAELVIAKLSSQPLPVDDPMDFLLLAGFDPIAHPLM